MELCTANTLFQPAHLHSSKSQGDSKIPGVRGAGSTFTPIFQNQCCCIAITHCTQSTNAHTIK